MKMVFVEAIGSKVSSIGFWLRFAWFAHRSAPGNRDARTRLQSRGNQFGNRDDVYASRFGFEIHLSSRAKKPVVLVGHSYGGAVITEAGDLPKVQSLIYLAAYAPQAGESVFDIATAPTTGEDKAPLLPPSDNFLLCDSEKFLTSFAAGVDPKTARFMRRYPGVWEPCRQRSPPPPGRTSRPISW
ncbi:MULTISPECIES: alpha/beta hydrolase [Mesorhizobium]|uniref:alpha/beta hydrolase n=1 Tax=Mesorhizobium TaxID=68287 RepID=UPI00267D5053